MSTSSEYVLTESRLLPLPFNIKRRQKKTNQYSKLNRTEDTDRPCQLRNVSLSVDPSTPKLQLEGHLQNHQGDGYQGPNALSPGDNLPRSGLSQHL